MLTAITQLAVTGSNAYAKYTENPTGASELTSYLTGLGMPTQAATTTADQIMQDFKDAETAVRNPLSAYVQRTGLANGGWIAVSGEDDPPDFPVNVRMYDSKQFQAAQFHTNLSVNAIPLSVRYLIASNQGIEIPPGISANPSPAMPAIPAGDQVILYIHGEGSRCEEASDFIPALMQAAQDRGLSFTVLVCDLPGNGYTTSVINGVHETVPHHAVASMPPFCGVSVDGYGVDTAPFGSSLLDFVEDTIVQFVNTVVGSQGKTVAAVVGGSLGGHMGLRLNAAAPPWLESVVAWSPASVWDSATPLQVVPGKTVPIPNTWLASAMNFHRAQQAEDSLSSRSDFFSTVFDQDTANLQVPGVVTTIAGAVAGAQATAALIAASSIPVLGWALAAADVAYVGTQILQLPVIPPQPQMWYRDDWGPAVGTFNPLPCPPPPAGSPIMGRTKLVAICGDRLDRQEVYNANFRQWHWRLAGECVAYSFDPGQIGKPLLLMAGDLDNYFLVELHDRTIAFGRALIGPGTTQTVYDTGHSIHNERPAFLAQQVLDFITEWATGGWDQHDLTAIMTAAPCAGGGLTSWADAIYQHVIYLDGNGHVNELYCPTGGGVWHVNDLTAIVSAPPAAAGGLTSWADATYQHVIYTDRAGHVHELYCPTGGGVWARHDLTAVVSAPPALPAGGLTSWADAHNQHVIFLDAGGHVHELYCPTGGGTWGHNDLTAIVPAPAAVGGLTSWADHTYQHVIFLDAGGHVHELYYLLAGGVWAVNDLTAIVSAPPAAPAGGLTSWADAHNQHVIFLDAGGHVHELYCPTGGGTWHINDLTAIVSAPPAVVGGLTSWADAHNQHVIFLDAGGHVHEMYCPTGGGAWGHNDLTAILGAPATAGGGLTSWVDATYQHVIFLDAAGHLHEMYYPLAGGVWGLNDLTTIVSAPPAAPAGELTSWADAHYQHVLHPDSSGHVHELYCPTGGGMWGHHDLTTILGAPQVAPGTAVSSWALTSWADATYQHVIFLDAAGHVHEMYCPTGGGTWGLNDLTTIVGAPPAYLGRGLTSWVDATYQHVIFLDAAGHVHEMYCRTGGGTWGLNDLTAIVGAPRAAFDSALTSWVDATYQHVIFLDPDAHVRELYCPTGGGTWGLNDLTLIVHSPAAYLFSALTSWADPSYQHVIFLDGSSHVRELYYPLNSKMVLPGVWVPPKVWGVNDLTQILQAQSPPPAAGSALTSWADAYYQHVIYLDGNAHVHEMYCPTGGGIWGHNDLTTMVSGPPAAAASALTSWADPLTPHARDRYLHVIYTDGSGHVHELYRPAG